MNRQGQKLCTCASSPRSVVFIRTRLVRSRCVERFSPPAEILNVHISVRLEPGRDAPVALRREDGCWAAGGWGGGGGEGESCLLIG